MLVDEKPPLDEELLMHFGVKGMHWGQRKARPSGGSGGSAAPKHKMSTKKKVALNVGLAAGAAVSIYLLAKYGSKPSLKLEPIKVPKLNVTGVPKPHVPSPFEMHLQAGRAAQLNTMNRIGAQKLTDQAWRDAAKLAQERRKMDDVTRSLLGNNEALLNAWNNPNHVWRL